MSSVYVTFDCTRTVRQSGYDAAGNLLGYTLTDAASAAVNTYRYTLGQAEGYQEQSIAATGTKSQPGRTTNGYDASGNLISISDATLAANDRRFVNDAAGRALQVTQNGHVQRQLIANGEVLVNRPGFRGGPNS